VTRGIDHNRVSMLTAVLMRRAALKLGECDIFVNTAGGLAVEDPAADVGVCLAVASSFRERALPEGVAAFGEVSLTGRVRYVSRGALRVRELAQRGFTRVLMPARTLEEVRQQGAPKGVTLDAVGDIGEALRGTIG
jgi:DNA repair protein RadA/Sms